MKKKLQKLWLITIPNLIFPIWTRWIMEAQGYWHLNVKGKDQYWSDASQRDCPLWYCSYCGKGKK